MIPCLTIAGSDPSGGAGLQADLKTFAAHGVYGMSVITAVTVQNTLGVSAVHPIEPTTVVQQINAILSDIPPAVIKIGMLHSAEIIKAVVSELQNSKPPKIIIDPVLVSSSGRALLQPDAVQALVRELIPMAALLTPNTDELVGLLNVFDIQCEAIEDEKQLLNASLVLAEKMQDAFKRAAPAILTKGGHIKGDAADLLLFEGEVHWLRSERVENPNTHGTGCTLSAAIAANIARGQELLEAVQNAKKYLTSALEKQLNIGHGCGPLWHGD